MRARLRRLSRMAPRSELPGGFGVGGVSRPTQRRLFTDAQGASVQTPEPSMSFTTVIRQPRRALNMVARATLAPPRAHSFAARPILHLKTPQAS